MIFGDDVDVFADWDSVVGSWDDFQQAVNHLTDSYATNSFVWRGQANVAWGLKSALYRAVEEKLGPRTDEDALNAAEKRLLTLARQEWRLDGMSALETFARLQHVGVPTRLLDVTFNPMIAAWFAVSSVEDEAADARLFAFALRRAPIELTRHWGARTPRWHELMNDRTRVAEDWGTGLGRQAWRPPAYNSRIPAQNAAFIIDGVPVDAADHGFGRVHPQDRTPYTAEQLRTVSSIPLKLTSIQEGRLPLEKAPVFTFRIEARAKREILSRLEERFGYRFSTIYADVEGMAQYLREDTSRLLG